MALNTVHSNIEFIHRNIFSENFCVYVITCVIWSMTFMASYLVVIVTLHIHNNCVVLGNFYNCIYYHDAYVYHDRIVYDDGKSK